MEGIEEWVGDTHIVAPTATFWPEQGAALDRHTGTKPKVPMHSRRREQVVVPKPAMPGIIEEVGMAKTTGGCF